MKTFEIVTIFPKIFESYFGESIIKRAKGNGLISINAHDLRRWSLDKHRKVDDTPYGGGAGMVMNVQPIYESVKSLKSNLACRQAGVKSIAKTRVILFSAKGKKYTQKDARRLSKYDNLILICGRYEGVDERVAKHIADEELSIGEYVLTGGEIPAMVLVDSISRLVPGVLGNVDSLKNESFNEIKNLPAGRQGLKFKIKNSALEYPQYTKPDDFQGWSVPKVLLSGNHEKIEEWRDKNSKISN